MLLAIEQGNTNTLFAVHDGSELDRPVALGHPVDPHRRRIRRLAEPASGDAGDWRSSRPDRLHHLQRRAAVDLQPAATSPRRYLKVEPLVIGENVDLGVPVRILTSRPKRGRTGWSTPSARTWSIPAISWSSTRGTATTFDVVAGDGGFEGGIIAPGINLSMQALHEAAAKLPRDRHPAARRRNRVIGTRHRQRHAIGHLLGLYRPDRRAWLRGSRSEWDKPMTVVATGGVASLFEGATASHRPLRPRSDHPGPSGNLPSQSPKYEGP